MDGILYYLVKDYREDGGWWIVTCFFQHINWTYLYGYNIDSLEIEDMKTEKLPNTLDCGTGKHCLVETRRIPGHDKTARMTQADIPLWTVFPSEWRWFF